MLSQREYCHTHKEKLIDNWIDQSASKLYDFSPWKNKSFGV